MRYWIILLSIFLVAVSSVNAQTASPEPFLSADEIDSLTLTPDEYEEKYEEEFDPDEYGDHPDFGTCGLSSNTDEARDFVMSLLGPWTLGHNAGYVIAGGMTLPYQGDPKMDTVTFERVGNTLILTHPESPTPMVFKWPGEGDWRWANDDPLSEKPAPGLSSEDIELVMNCSLSDMPRLIGRATVESDGITMNFTYRIVVVLDDIITGIMHVQGVGQGFPFFSARTVTFSR